MASSFLVPRFEAFLRRQLEAEGLRFDFTVPAVDSVSWRVFRNPLALYIGGIAAVLLELAEPRVRSGVWEHTTFRADPLRRMRRTGMAAMVTVYGARSGAEKMIAGIGRMHAKVAGLTPQGVPYRADDPELLRWVHATALFGFMEAYHRFVTPLSAEERDRFVAEGMTAAGLYGAVEPPASEAELTRLFEGMLPWLEGSAILDEFVGILRRLPLLPGPTGPLNLLLIGASVSLLPDAVREVLGFGEDLDLSRRGEALLKFAGRRIERLPLATLPVADACRRMGLPADHLCPRRGSTAAHQDL